MMRWIVIGPNLPEMFVYAESFDEAIAAARVKDPKYNGAYVDEWEVEAEENVDCAWR